MAKRKKFRMSPEQLAQIKEIMNYFELRDVFESYLEDLIVSKEKGQILSKLNRTLRAVLEAQARRD